MSAFLFHGWVSSFQQGRFTDGCTTGFVYGGDLETCSKVFETILLAGNHAEEPVPTKLENMVSVPVLDQVLTETGPQPVEWEGLAAEAQKSLEETPPDDQTQGYWVDPDSVVRPRRLSADMASLRKELPADVESGLNWEDKQAIFVISVVKPQPPREIDYEAENPAAAEARHCPFPEVTEKELAAIVRARNSVVAAWLFRKWAAADGRFLTNSIQLAPWFFAANAQSALA